MSKKRNSFVFAFAPRHSRDVRKLGLLLLFLVLFYCSANSEFSCDSSLELMLPIVINNAGDSRKSANAGSVVIFMLETRQRGFPSSFF